MRFIHDDGFTSEPQRNKNTPSFSTEDVRKELRAGRDGGCLDLLQTIIPKLTVLLERNTHEVVVGGVPTQIIDYMELKTAFQTASDCCIPIRGNAQRPCLPAIHG
jgi:hypothetical protein